MCIRDRARCTGFPSWCEKRQYRRQQKERRRYLLPEYWDPQWDYGWQPAWQNRKRPEQRRPKFQKQSGESVPGPRKHQRLSLIHILRGHNLYDIFYGRYKKQETEILTQYIELAPREDFADILDSIERFIYFESRKNWEKYLLRDNAELWWSFAWRLSEILHFIKRFDIHLTSACRWILFCTDKICSCKEAKSFHNCNLNKMKETGKGCLLYTSRCV